jgi:hypothetical protein
MLLERLLDRPDAKAARPALQPCILHFATLVSRRDMCLTAQTSPWVLRRRRQPCQLGRSRVKLHGPKNIPHFVLVVFWYFHPSTSRFHESEGHDGLLPVPIWPSYCPWHNVGKVLSDLFCVPLVREIQISSDPFPHTEYQGQHIRH